MSWKRRPAPCACRSSTATRSWDWTGKSTFGLLGEDYERYFKRTVSLKVKKEVAEDPERLDAMVLALAEALGAENFSSLFEVEQSLTPTKAYTESTCQFPAETRAALNLIGVRQIVAVAAK